MTYWTYKDSKIKTRFSKWHLLVLVFYWPAIRDLHTSVIWFFSPNSNDKHSHFKIAFPTKMTNLALTIIIHLFPLNFFTSLYWEWWSMVVVVVETSCYHQCHCCVWSSTFCSCVSPLPSASVFCCLLVSNAAFLSVLSESM